jgi:hypothetical protein
MPEQPVPEDHREAMQAALRYVETHLVEATAEQPLVWQNGARQYRVHLKRDPVVSPTELEHAVLEVTADVNGVAMTARLPARRVAFSHYAQLVDRWNPDVSLAGDRILGRFHANTGINVEADRDHAPLITGLSTVAGGVHFAGRARREEVFPSGLQTGAPPLPLPRTVLDWEAMSPGEEHVHRLSRDTHVLFRADGSYQWREQGSDAVNTVRPSHSPWLLVADQGVDVQVEGTVAGSLLVYSPTRVTVSGDLRYAHDPQRGPSDDFLGLVSDAYVEIADSTITGPGDLEVQAAVFAGRQFRVRHYRRRDGGTLKIFGSVTAGSLSATEPRFSTLLEYDSRLEHSRPAYFPMTDHYELDDLHPTWTLAAANAAD